VETAAQSARTASAAPAAVEPRASVEADASSTPVAPATAAPTPTVAAANATSPSIPAPAPALAAALPTVLVHKTRSCGCCKLWVDHLRAHGFQVDVRDHDDLADVKQRLGVPMDKASCHTAEVGGYFVEGHVPAEDVRRLLTEKPQARGITAPGMPLGSPGMEMPDGSAEPYTVELVNPDGSAVAYASHGP
jgi:hypothetical protein